MADEDNKIDNEVQPDPDVDNDVDTNEDDELFDKDRAKAAMSKKNRENQSLRRTNKDLEAERDALREKALKWEQHEKDQLSKEERFAADLKAEKERADKLATELLRTQVQVKRPDLTDAQIKRLMGTTVDELVADAEEVFGKPADKTRKVVTPNPNDVSGGTDPRNEPEELDPKKLAAGIRRR